MNSRVAMCALLLLTLVGGTGIAGAQDVPVEPTPITSDKGFTYKFSVDYFVQISSRQGFPVTNESFTDDESFLWERLRPKLSGTNGRLSFLLEGQDTHSIGRQFTVRKAWFDILNAYVDIQASKQVSFRVGRRQGDFDAIPRLIRTPDFAAVVRSFDLAEMRWRRKQTEARAFYFRTVENLPDRFNTWRKGEHLWSTFVRQGVGRHSFQTYLTTRLNADVVGETGSTGSGAIYAWEVQAAGPTPFRNVDFSVEHVLQRGHFAGDKVRAYGLFASLSADPAPGQNIEMRYVRTSGDQSRTDGVRGGYDIFYMALGPLSPLGIMRGPNLNSVSIGSNHRIGKTTLIWRVHEHRLNTLNDGWYGSRVIRRAGATSPRLGTEIDTLVAYEFSPRMTARIGYFRIFSGDYLKGTGAFGSPYEVRVQIFGGF